MGNQKEIKGNVNMDGVMRESTGNVIPNDMTSAEIVTIHLGEPNVDLTW